MTLIAVQGAIGYAQYFGHMPAGLVWVHASDAILVWIVVLRLLFALRDRGTVGQRRESLAHGEKHRTAAPEGGAQTVGMP